MSDGQSETCESIAAQNACISMRLERGEAVRWHDGVQWQVGHVLMLNGERIWMDFCNFVQTCEGTYVVSPDALEPYGPRCEECGGEGVLALPCREVDDEGNCCAWIMEPCPACRGSGRKGA